MMFLEICMQIYSVVFAWSRQINKQRYAKTINLLCKDNKVFVKYQVQLGGGANQKKKEKKMLSSFNIFEFPFRFLRHNGGMFARLFGWSFLALGANEPFLVQSFFGILAIIRACGALDSLASISRAKVMVFVRHHATEDDVERPRLTSTCDKYQRKCLRKSIPLLRISFRGLTVCLYAPMALQPWWEPKRFYEVMKMENKNI